MIFSSSLIMRLVALAALTGSIQGSAVKRANPYDVQPFFINLSADAPRMLALVNETRLPSKEEYDGLGSSAGISLDTLETLQAQWIEKFDWHREEAALNK